MCLCKCIVVNLCLFECHYILGKPPGEGTLWWGVVFSDLKSEGHLYNINISAPSITPEERL